MLLKFFIVVGFVVGYALIGYFVAKAGDAMHKYFYGHAFLEDGGGWFLAIALWPLLLIVFTIFHLALVPVKLCGYLESLSFKVVIAERPTRFFWNLREGYCYD